MPKCSPHSLSMHMVDHCLLAIYRQCCIQFQFTLTSALYYCHEIYYNDSPGIAPAYLKIKPPPKTFKILKLIPQAQWLPAAMTSTPPPRPPWVINDQPPCTKDILRGVGEL